VFRVDEQGNEGPTLWTQISADEGYRLGTEEFGNGVVSTRTYYDPAECLGQTNASCSGRLKRIDTNVPGQALRFAEHAWDANGNLAALERSGANPPEMLFEYDHLDRLTREHFTHISGTDATARVYAYDAAGRGDLTSKTGAGSYGC
jgi:hypothetical protein